MSVKAQRRINSRRKKDSQRPRLTEFLPSLKIHTRRYPSRGPSSILSRKEETCRLISNREERQRRLEKTELTVLSLDSFNLVLRCHVRIISRGIYQYISASRTLYAKEEVEGLTWRDHRRLLDRPSIHERSSVQSTDESHSGRPISKDQEKDSERARRKRRIREERRGETNELTESSHSRSPMHSSTYPTDSYTESGSTVLG